MNTVMTSGDKIAVKNGHTHAVFSYGRFQPPTLGHAVIIHDVVKKAEELKADGYIFVSNTLNKLNSYKKTRRYKNIEKDNCFKSFDVNENPLSVYQKVKYMKLMYAAVPIGIINTITEDCRKIHDIIAKLSEKYTSLTMIVGSDRVSTFKNLLRDFENLNVISAGEKRTLNKRNGIKAISGTKMREAAITGDLPTFSAGVKMGNLSDEDIIQMMKDIRTGLGYKPDESLRLCRNTRKTR